MVNGQLMMAMDWRKKKGEEHGRYSYRVGDEWYVVRHGPGFKRIYRITEFDAAGLAMLQSYERKDLSDATDQSVQP